MEIRIGERGIGDAAVLERCRRLYDSFKGPTSYAPGLHLHGTTSTIDIAVTPVCVSAGAGISRTARHNDVRLTPKWTR